MCVEITLEPVGWAECSDAQRLPRNPGDIAQYPACSIVHRLVDGPRFDALSRVCAFWATVNVGHRYAQHQPTGVRLGSMEPICSPQRVPTAHRPADYAF